MAEVKENNDDEYKCYPNQLEFFGEDSWLMVPVDSNGQEIQQQPILLTSPDVGPIPAKYIAPTDPEYMYAEDVIEMQINDMKKQKLDAEKIEKATKELLLKERREKRRRKKNEMLAVKEMKQKDKKVLRKISKIADLYSKKNKQ